MDRFTIFGDLNSGNCLKVKYVSDFLGFSYDWVDIDILKSETQSEKFLRLNPAGQVPVIELKDGRALTQSNAIIQFLSEGTSLFPEDAFTRAEINSCLFWEQYSHEPYIAVCRFHMVYLGRTAAERESWRVEKGEQALDLMNRTLSQSDWFVGNGMTVADISLFAYTQFVTEGGFSLHNRPAVKDWIVRVRRELKL